MVCQCPRLDRSVNFCVARIIETVGLVVFGSAVSQRNHVMLQYIECSSEPEGCMSDEPKELLNFTGYKMNGCVGILLFFTLVCAISGLASQCQGEANAAVVQTEKR